MQQTLSCHHCDPPDVEADVFHGRKQTGKHGNRSVGGWHFGRFACSFLLIALLRDYDVHMLAPRESVRNVVDAAAAAMPSISLPVRPIAKEMRKGMSRKLLSPTEVTSSPRLGENEVDREDKSLIEADAGSEDSDDMALAFNGLSKQNALARESKPVYVSIDGKRYYGGLETLFHGALTSKTCRLLNACIRADGVVLLPKWMRRYDDLLSFHCDLTRVLFILDNNQPPTTTVKDVDLFGLTPPPSHMPSFLRAFLPALISFDAIYNSEIRGTSRVCYTRAGRGCAAGNLKPLEAGNIKPAVFLDSKLRGISHNMSWPLQLVRLTAPRALAKTRALFWGDFYPPGDDFTKKCFKSLVVSRPPRSKEMTSPAMFTGLRFFADNDIDKKKPISHGVSGACKVNVTFMNRRPNPSNPDQILSRYIPNIPEVSAALNRLANGSKSIELTIHKVRTEGRSIKWQMNAMQRTDVLVAGHGSQLTNMIFMRNGASVLEIFPFTYYPQTFEKMAMYMANMRYDSIIAKPDRNAFITCMAHYYNNTRNSSALEAREIVRRYESAVENYSKSDKNTHSFTSHGLDSSLLNVRICVEMQSLDTPAKTLADRIFSMVQASCNYTRL
jgi:hypothetical protein